jgi:single-stranded-DNA-specific exonuclease
LPDPFGLKGIDAAVARLQRALAQREQICVYGDYDVDGVTSTALLVGTLRKLGGQVDFCVPQRLVEGYGLNVQALEKLSKRGTRLVVSA